MNQSVVSKILIYYYIVNKNTFAASSMTFYDAQHRKSMFNNKTKSEMNTAFDSNASHLVRGYKTGYVQYQNCSNALHLPLTNNRTIPYQG